MKEPHSIYALGDSAITLDLGDRIEEELNRKALAMRERLVSLHLPGVLDILVAYSSVTLFYDPARIMAENEAAAGGAYDYLKQLLDQVWQNMIVPFEEGGEASAPIIIPVCYDDPFAPDLRLLAYEKGISREEAIRLHISRTYRVYMIGFLPGFAYLGTVDPLLEIARKRMPVPVPAGSVGIAGSQTGIYPLNSPGGWQIIGRTPTKLFDPQAEIPVRLEVGNQVRFRSVSGVEFAALSLTTTANAGA